MNAALYTVGAAGYDDTFSHATQLFVPALLRAARLEAGHDVLDVATGTGEAAAAAASIVGPFGSVTAGDISPAMLDIARAKLRDTRITFEAFDGHMLPYAAESFDVVTCQLGLMLFADPARALGEFRRVLRTGGRVAITVSTTPERTLFLRVAAIIARHVPSRAAAIGQHFGVSDQQELQVLIAGAGFHDVRVQTERREFRFESFDAYFAGIERGATLSGQEYIRLQPNVQHAVRADVKRSLVHDPNGTIAVPMEVLIGSGQR
jgi:ubiquinone/menaquinone biosynthesis C-methylase UbiE